MYLAPACSMWLLLGVALLEWPTMAAENALGLIAAKPLLYLLAAAMGFGVNSLAYIVIQVPFQVWLNLGRWHPSSCHACHSCASHSSPQRGGYLRLRVLGTHRVFLCGCGDS